MVVLPDFETRDRVLPQDLAARVERERQAHEDPHIDDTLRGWWGRFPHVFDNPAAKRLDDRYHQEMGDVSGKVILEYGCGQGGFAAWLYGRGANIVGIDIATYNIEQSVKRFEAMNADPARYRFAIMDAHALQLPDASVDRVAGNGILHHLDLPMAFKEIERVLKPGGKALFFEPLDGHPVMKVYRLVSQYQTDDEAPLRGKELAYLRDTWGAELDFSGLLTLPVAAVTSLVIPKSPNNPPARAASWLERRVSRIRALETWNRNALIIYRKPMA